MTSDYSKNRIVRLLTFLSVCSLSLALSGCNLLRQRQVEDPVAGKLKTIVLEVKNYYNEAVEIYNAKRMTQLKYNETLKFFDDKDDEIRGLMGEAISRGDGKGAARVTANCLAAENYLVTLRESFRRLHTGDTGSANISFSLARTYYRDVLKLPEQVSSRDNETRTSREQFSASKPNIILIVADTLRADHIGAYGYKRETTPFLDAFSKKGVLYLNAFSQAPHTPASTATILTGTYPAKHRLVAACVWNKELSLVRDLKKAGYATAAFSANPIVSRENGYGEGFDSFVYHPEAIAEVLVNDAFIWLNSRKKSDAPVFIYLHLMDPHESYNAPLPYTEKFNPSRPRKFFTSWIYGVLMDDIAYDFDPDALGWIPEDRAYALIAKQKGVPFSRSDIDDEAAYYDGEIAYTDHSLGGMIKALKGTGFLDNAVVALTSDHGEGFMEHGFMEHGNTLYDEQLHVPLIFWDGEKRFKPGTVSGVVELTDVMPTLLSSAGLAVPDSADGKILPISDKNAAAGASARIAFASTWYGHSFKGKKDIHKFSARTSGYKLIYTPDNKLYELYNLKADPGEKTNIMPGPGVPTPDNLLPALDKYFHKFDWWSEKSAAKKENPNLKKNMKSLGYIR